MNEVNNKNFVLSHYPHAYILKWANPSLFSNIRYCIYNGFSISKICYGVTEKLAWRNAKTIIQNKIINETTN